MLRPVTFHEGCMGLALAVALVVACCATSAIGQVRRTDRAGDAVVRRTDPGAQGPLNPVVHRLPDILSYSIGAWSPANPAASLFEGEWSVGAEFFRLDVKFAGLVNPPGPLGGTAPFNPFLHGPSPVFGYVEIDVDADVETGGEFLEPHRRYPGVVARFGGHPSAPRFRDRVALDYSAFDFSLATPPFCDRGGEDFHLALHGRQIKIISRSNNDNTVFDAGETWVLGGRFLHRAHAYEMFSYACCQGVPGSYEPDSELQFKHSTEEDITTVSLVFPLTNSAAASMTGSPVEPMDGDASNQSSVEEGLDDLVFSVAYAPAGWRNHPSFPIISKWGSKSPVDHLDPSRWNLSLIVGTSYTEPQTGLFVWTDVSPDPVFGDLNGDQTVNSADLTQFDSFLSSSDGVVGLDADEAPNGTFVISNFGPNFTNC